MTMTDSDQLPPESDAASPAERDSPRRTRGIRFSESEWREVLDAAERRGVPAAEFVRTAVLGAARGDGEAPSLAALAPLIERTFRYAWVLATLRRDEMAAAGRSEEVERLVESARKLQQELQHGERGGADPGVDAADG
ncbi:MAG: hypothetical protein F4Z84_07835 [Gammaproteobacteria bacterium]|nr:hypothetical protein [Gammaproteobacteria bacterium]